MKWTKLIILIILSYLPKNDDRKKKRRVELSIKNIHLNNFICQVFIIYKAKLT